MELLVCFLLTSIALFSPDVTGKVIENPVMSTILEYGKFDESTHNNISVNDDDGPLLNNSHTIPKKPRSFQIKSVTSTSIYLVWDEPELSTEPIISYTVSLAGTQLSLMDTITDKSYNFTGLKPNTEYNVKVQANTAEGSGEWTEELRVRTYKVGVPQKPRNLLIKSVTSTSFNLVWDEPDPSPEPVTSYSVSLRGAQFPAVYTTTDKYFSFTALKPDTEYFVKVMAHTETGSGEWTEEESVRTNNVGEHTPCDDMRAYIKCQQMNATCVVDSSAVEGFRCVCEAGFIEKNGICTEKTVCDDMTAYIKCTHMRANCITDSSALEGFRCICKVGFIEKNGICTDLFEDDGGTRKILLVNLSVGVVLVVFLLCNGICIFRIHRKLKVVHTRSPSPGVM